MLTAVPSSSSAVSTRKLARKLNKNKKRNNCLGAPCCAPCATFTVIAVVFVPLLVFVIAAIFALPLWASECSLSGAAEFCDYYQWWKCASLLPRLTLVPHT